MCVTLQSVSSLDMLVCTVISPAQEICKGTGKGKQNKAGHILFCLAEMLQAHADGSAVDPASVSFLWGTGEP